MRRTQQDPRDGRNSTSYRDARVITTDAGFAYGREFSNGQLPPKLVAALLCAVLNCRDQDVKDAFIRNFVEGIAMEDPEVRGTLNDYLSQVSQDFRLATPSDLLDADPPI